MHGPSPLPAAGEHHPLSAAYLGVEIPVVDVLRVQVDHPPCDVGSQVHLFLPAEGDILAGQELFQAPTVNVLQTEAKREAMEAMLGWNGGSATGSSNSPDRDEPVSSAPG